MSIHFHPLTVKDVRRETEDCVSVLFEVPENLSTHFQYKQGQSLTLRAQLNGQEIRRTYSICSSPLDKEWRVAIKKADSGLFSTYANEQLKKGDVLEVMQPVGKFYTDLDPKNKKNYLAFAAGSGITPILSIIKTTLRTEPLSSFTLVFSNRHKNSIIFKEDLQAIKDRYMDRFVLIHLFSQEKTDSPLNEGRISSEKLNTLASVIDYPSMDDVFICGPEQMIFTVNDFFLQKGVAKKNLHFELFTTPGQKTIIVNSKPSHAALQQPQHDVSIRLDGVRFDFKLGKEGESILDAALKQGADLPFACKGGVCCTCKAKLLEGDVQMDVHWGLEQEEIEQGYILTCQSHPISQKVVIDFDAR